MSARVAESGGILYTGNIWNDLMSVRMTGLYVRNVRSVRAGMKEIGREAGAGVTGRRKKAALTACSDPVTGERLEQIAVLADVLREEGLDVEPAPYFFEGRDLTPDMKARSLMKCFTDPEMDFIFDVSGGDLANFVLPYLDYTAIRSSRAIFFGYSDLTTVINAIIARTGRRAVNYQIRHVLYEHAEEQRRYLREKILPGRLSARDDLEVRFLRGSAMHGRVLGGNLRCFLKLAGTPYWPDMRGSILLLESMGGGVYQMMTALEQYRQMGVFDEINGVLLGTFSKMERENLHPRMEDLVLGIVPEKIPVPKTEYVGHYSSARAIVLGMEMFLERQT